jgi:tetratricopeptide (TPR) repeat protein
MMGPLIFLLTAIAFLIGQADTPHIKAALAQYQAGKAAQQRKQVQTALDCFRQAIEIEPTFLDAHEALIAVYLDSGHRLEAAASITQLLEMQPNLVPYGVLLGQILLEQKETERALAQFSLALKRDPNNADGLLGFASAARQMGMEDRAAEALERGRKHHPLDKRFKTAPPSRSQ